MTVTTTAKFFVGQIVHHKMFDYRGVVVDVDPLFSGSDEWYESYVAERNLEADDSAEPIRHPELDVYFAGIADGIYFRRQIGN